MKSACDVVFLQHDSLFQESLLQENKVGFLPCFLPFVLSFSLCVADATQWILS